MKENVVKNIWTIGSYDTEKVNELMGSLSLGEFLCKILVSKGIDTVQKADTYLNSNINNLADPFLLKDMEKAVERIKSAVKDKERIMIYGDYDVDGVTSVAALYKYLSFKGADVHCYIPERINEGYGLNVFAIDKFSADGVKLIITVDSGITSHEEIEHAKALGIDVVITDHHECREELPDAIAVVNPHRAGSEYPFRELAGVGVVFRLICAYEEAKNLSNIAAKYSDIVALGTVADVMPIVGENRIIVKHGLSSLANTKNKGLRSLIELTFAERRNNQRSNITAASIGFGLAPRINAAGRIGDVNKALKLLITDSKAEADEIASYLCAVNRERQLVENMIFEEAVKMIESGHDFDNDKVIVLVSEKWHLGVIGIVASKITERYKLPSILISVDGEVGKGSCRSIKGFNINEAISHCKQHLVKYGGHELAAGLTIDKGKVGDFRRAINEYAKNSFDFDSVCSYLNADFEIDVSDITIEHAKEITSLEPFGLQNPLPLFCIKDVKIAELYPIGEGRHLKMIIEKNGYTATALYFGMSEERFAFVEGDVCDMLCTMDVNDFRGTLSVQVTVKDTRISEREKSELLHASETFEKIQNGVGAVEKDDIPVMSDFKAGFLYFKSALCEFDKQSIFDVRKTAKDISRKYSVKVSPVKLCIMLLVFAEKGLVKADFDGIESVRLSLCKTEGKVNIEDSEIMSKIKLI